MDHSQTSPVAIILAAGVGRRFGSALEDRPKALLEVSGQTLLERLLEQLRNSGVSEIVVVVGYGGHHIEKVVANQPDVVILQNPEYRRGAIRSLWTAEAWLDRSVLVMDADVWCPEEMISRLVGSKHENCFLLDSRSEASGEEQMLMVRDGRVIDIARIPRGTFDSLGESVGFLKLGASTARVLRDLVAARVEVGDIDLEHEEVYPELLVEREVGFEVVDDLQWTEVDFPEDLARARELATGA